MLLDASRYPAHDRAEVIRSSLSELAGSPVEPPGGDGLVPGRGMILAEMAQVYTCQAAGNGESATLQIPLDVLDVPRRDVRNAARRLARSPVYELARQHLLALSRYTAASDAPQPSAQHAAFRVLRALVTSCGTG